MSVIPKPLQTSDEEALVDEVSAIIAEKTGVQLGKKNAAMIQSRLLKRMITLGNLDAKKYLEYLKLNLSEEAKYLVALLTTHHTFFFREFSHFEYLDQKILPELIPLIQKQGRKTIRVLSAACSRGHEVYSLAMFLRQVLPKYGLDVNFKILGIDVDADSVQIAKNGVYRWDEIKEAPSVFLEGAWVRGTGEISDFVKAKSGIRDACDFKVGNLVNLAPSLGNEKFDIIFCRNVFIYFTSEQIQKSSSELCAHLEPHGYFFVGLSESLGGMNSPVKMVGPSAYRFKEYVEPKAVKTSPKAPGVSAPTEPVISPDLKVVPPAPQAQPIRVLCVDDSMTVLTLLKKVLTREYGFEVVATAVDGIDAAKKLAANKVDLMTLDIHMPNQDGLAYLKQNFKPGHPPVIMVSSVSREDLTTAQTAMNLGASDYVEKPTLQNLASKAEEIRNKLKGALSAYSAKGGGARTLDQSFAKGQASARRFKAVRIVLADSKRVQDAKQFATKAFEFIDNPVILLGADDAAAFSLQREFKEAKMLSHGGTAQVKASSKEFFLETLSGAAFLATLQSEGYRFSIANFGVSASQLKASAGWLLKIAADEKNCEFLSEDGTNDDWAAVGAKVHAMPKTSFVYHTESFVKKSGELK